MDVEGWGNKGDAGDFGEVSKWRGKSKKADTNEKKKKHNRWVLVSLHSRVNWKSQSEAVLRILLGSV